MDLSVAFMGTGGSVPTARRATACLLVRAGGTRIMIDCGEGAQRQMMRSTGLVQVDEIYITHLHADHYLGLPGLLKTWDLHDRQALLRVFGPRGTRDLFNSLARVIGKIAYELEVTQVEPGEAVAGDGFQVNSFAVEHRVPALGYALVENPRPGRFDADRARELGVTDRRDFGRLQRGEVVAGPSGAIRPEQVMGEARPGRKIVATGDTAPCEMTAIAAHQAQLLIHDASFGDDEIPRAAETGHSTARQAAELAHGAGVGMLALVHVSARYYVSKVLDEAREAHPNTVAPRDFDLVELPFPERGEPRLIERGAATERPPETSDGDSASAVGDSTEAERRGAEVDGEGKHADDLASLRDVELTGETGG